HYKPDNWRASQVRNMGIVEGNAAVSDNDWETVTKGGDAAIQKWIDGQLDGKSCTVVLIGAATADRKWIDYEIKKSWGDKKGLVGIYIHNLKDREQRQSLKGSNPFAGFTMRQGTVAMSNIVKAYDPPYSTSTDVYKHVQENIQKWVEEAISI